MAKRRTAFTGWVVLLVIVAGMSQCNRSGNPPMPSQPELAAHPSIEQPAAVLVNAPAPVDFRQGDAPVTPTPASIFQPITRFVTATTLNVRREPTGSGAVVDSLSSGSEITVYSLDGEWAQISAPGTSARWVHSDYLTDDRPIARAQPIAVQSLANQSIAPQQSRSEVIQRIIANSVRSYRGNCPCPYHTTASGRRCGGNSAYSRPGGASPICFEQDVTEAMIERFRN